MKRQPVNGRTDKLILDRVTVIGVVLAVLSIVQAGVIRAGSRSELEVSPHLQRPPDIPLERLDRPERTPVRLNVNTASPRQLQRLPGLGEAEAERISRGRPYKHKDELITRQILSQEAYDQIKDLITVE